MPTVTQEYIQGWVSCMDARCPGYTQREVEVTRETVALSYRDNGALNSDPIASVSNAIERSSIRVVQTGGECDVCHGPLLFTDQERIEYPQVSGQDDLALLNLNQQGQIRDEQMAGLKRDAQFARMETQLAELRAELASRPRGPGRPRKVEDDE